MTTTERVGASVFTFMSDEIAKAPYIENGHTSIDLALPGTGDLTGRIKVYVSGGENKMHSHPREDHAFYVLSGQARFHVERDDNTVDVSANNAILLPRGTNYWFTNTGEENLVMLRVGSGDPDTFRLDANGVKLENVGIGRMRKAPGQSVA